MTNPTTVLPAGLMSAPVTAGPELATRSSGLEVVHGKRRNAAAVELLVRQLSQMGLTGSLYIGYPVVASVDQPVMIDALLTCLEHGVVVFDFSDLSNLPDAGTLTRRHDDLYLAVEAQLKKSRDLVVGRKLRRRPPSRCPRVPSGSADWQGPARRSSWPRRPRTCTPASRSGPWPSPSWTRSLYQQFRDLVRRFCFEHLNDEPDWERLAEQIRFTRTSPRTS